MNNKMAINTYLSTIESKNRINELAEQNRLKDTENTLTVVRWEVR